MYQIVWLQRMELNHRSKGYEPFEIPLLHSAKFYLSSANYSIECYHGQPIWQNLHLGKTFAMTL